MQLFSSSDKLLNAIFLPRNVEIPPIVGILTNMRRKNFMLAELSMEFFSNLGASSCLLPFPLPRYNPDCFGVEVTNLV